MTAKEFQLLEAPNSSGGSGGKKDDAPLTPEQEQREELQQLLEDLEVSFQVAEATLDIGTFTSYDEFNDQILSTTKELNKQLHSALMKFGISTRMNDEWKGFLAKSGELGKLSSGLIKKAREKLDKDSKSPDPKTPEAKSTEKKIDVTSWPEDQHPEQLKNLKTSVDAITAVLPANIDDIDYISLQVKLLSSQINQINRILLEPQHGRFHLYENKMEIIDHLNNQYVTPAEQLISDLLTEWYRLANDNLGITNLLLSKSITSIPLSEIPRTITQVNDALRVLETLKSNPDLLPQQVQFYKDKIVALTNMNQQLDSKSAADLDTERKSNDLRDWNVRVQPLIDLLSMLETTNESDVKPFSTSPGALDTTAISAFQEQLRNVRNLVSSELSKTKYKNNDSITERIIDLVGEDSNSGRAKGVELKLERMLSKSKDKKPIDQLTYPEFIQEMMSADYTEDNYGSKIPEGRLRDMVAAFNSGARNWTEGRDEREKLEFLALRYEYVLTRMYIKLSDGTGAASVNRKQLFVSPDGKNGGAIKEYGLKRHELLMCATHHPEWGDQTREIIRWIIESAAARDARSPYFVPGLTYDILAGAQGSTVLDGMVDRYFSGHHEKAKSFAKLLFKTFDMLTISLQELQHATKTRVHNDSLDMPDPVSLNEPLAAYVQAQGRYGGNKKDWRGWWLLYLPTIPDDGRFGSRGNADIIREMQRLVKLHQRVYFPTEAFEGKIPIPEYCRSMFPDVYDFVTLGSMPNPSFSDEKLSMMGNTYTKDGVQVGRTDGMDVIDIKNYANALDGWKTLLELTYKSVPQRLTKEQILDKIQEGGKGGLLALWVQAAGLAKIFSPKHLKQGLVPMLTHYVFRLIVHFDGDKQARKELIHEIVEALEYSAARGGLDAFPHEIHEVVRHVKDPRLLVKYDYTRNDQREAYIDAWWKSEHPSKPVPNTIAGNVIKFSTRPEDEEYGRLKRNEHAVPLPVERNGSLIQEKESK